MKNKEEIEKELEKQEKFMHNIMNEIEDRKISEIIVSTLKWVLS